MLFCLPAMKRDADSSFSVELRSKCTEAGMGAASVCWGTSGDAEYKEPHPRTSPGGWGRGQNRAESWYQNPPARQQRLLGPVPPTVQNALNCFTIHTHTRTGTHHGCNVFFLRLLFTLPSSPLLPFHPHALIWLQKEATLLFVP